MKKTMLILAALLVLPLSGCKHLQEIDEKLEDLDSRLTALEQQVSEMSGKLSGIQALLSGKYLVGSVTEMQDGTSFKVTLVDSDGKSTDIYVTGSTDGSEPPISVRQDTDGNWYWTAGGEWLLAGGEKIPAGGADSHIPLVRIEDGNWYVSMDGRNWTLAGSMLGGQGSLITGIDFTTDPRNVLFTLSDGSIVMLPKSQSMIRLQLLFDEDAITAIAAGTIASTGYEVIAPEGVEYRFSSYEPEGWKVSFSDPVSDKGTFSIQVPLYASDSKVFIVLNGSDGSSYVRIVEVRVKPNPVLSFGLPGLIVDGLVRPYTKGTDQIVRFDGGTGMVFGILEPKTQEQVLVSGINSPLSLSDRMTIGIDWKQYGEQVISRTLDVRAEKMEGGLAWLLDDEGNGVIIKM